MQWPLQVSLLQNMCTLCVSDQYISVIGWWTVKAILTTKTYLLTMQHQVGQPILRCYRRGW